MMSLWDALRMNMMISYQELVRTFLKYFRASIKDDASFSAMGIVKKEKPSLF